MQHHPNNDIHTFPTERGKGLAGTIIIHMVLFILLILVSFSVPPPPETEEGILVNFGTYEEGMGATEPSPLPVEEDVPPPLPDDTGEPVAEEQLLTQDFEDAPEVKETDPEAEKKRLEEIEANRRREEELEAERIRKEQEEIERQRLEAEQKREAEIIDRTRKALAESRNANTDSEGEGETDQPGNQGVPSGSVESDVHADGSGLGDEGISYDLQGRGFQNLPSPEYDYQGEGRVVVDVSVDRLGNVVRAEPGTKGSTTLDDYLLKVAKEAAMKAHFEPDPQAPPTQRGTITYNFILK